MLAACDDESARPQAAKASVATASSGLARETGFAFFTPAVGNRPNRKLNLRLRLPAKKNILLYADTERSADPLYFGRVNVPDAFVAVGIRGKKYAVVSALEFGRVKKTSDFDVVLPLERFMQRAREVWPQRKAGPAEVIYLLAKELGQKRFTVPADFAAGVY